MYGIDPTKLAHHFQHERLSKNGQRSRRMQAYKDSIKDRIFELNIQMLLHCRGLGAAAVFTLPTIIIGKYQKGKWLPEFLAKFFPVIVVDEFYSSQRCPSCRNFVEQEDKWRVKTCHTCKDTKDNDSDLQFNRDIMACRNMLQVFLHQVCFSQRPPPPILQGSDFMRGFQSFHVQKILLWYVFHPLTI